MGTTTRLSVLAIALLALACRGEAPRPAATTLSDDLRKDLDRAALPVSELASTSYQPAHFASAIELAPAPQKVQVPQKRAHRRPLPTPQKSTSKPTVTLATRQPEPMVSPQATAPAEPAPQPTQVAVAPAPAPTAGPRPTPNPTSYPADGGVSDDGGQGGGIGRVIGVILRGGSVGDDDHCEIHPGGRGGIHIAINQRIPIGSGTFPTPRW
jgi:hypothetical protein